jgi:hypothetical protein
MEYARDYLKVVHYDEAEDAAFRLGDNLTPRLQHIITYHRVHDVQYDIIGQAWQQELEQRQAQLRNELAQASVELNELGQPSVELAPGKGGARVGVGGRSRPDVVAQALSDAVIRRGLEEQMKHEGWTLPEDKEGFHERRRAGVRGSVKPSSLGVPDRINKKRGIIRCPNCNHQSQRWTYMREGDGIEFVRFEPWTQCQTCKFRWRDAIFYVGTIEIDDPIVPERMLALDKYRLQTLSRQHVVQLLRGPPIPLSEVRKAHMRIVRTFVENFVMKASTLVDLDDVEEGSAAIKRLAAELLRYGKAGFKLHENDYLYWTGVKAERHGSRLLSAALQKARAHFHALDLPKQWAQLVENINREAAAPAANFRDGLDGWDFDEEKLVVVEEQLQEMASVIVGHYERILQHIVVTGIACGANHTMLINANRELWAFGESSFGQTGTGDIRPQLKPTLVEVAEPTDYDILMDQRRIAATACSMHFRCKLSEEKAHSVRKHGTIVWYNLLSRADRRYNVLRIKYRATRPSTLLVRTKAIDGPVLAEANLVDTRALQSDEGYGVQVIGVPLIQRTIHGIRAGSRDAIVIQFTSDAQADVYWIELA